MESEQSFLHPQKVIKTEPESNGTSASPLESNTGAPFTVNKLDIRQNGYIEVLKKVVVQIERLRDIDKPSAGLFPLKMSESPQKKETPTKKPTASPSRGRVLLKRNTKSSDFSTEMIDSTSVTTENVISASKTQTIVASTLTAESVGTKSDDVTLGKKERKRMKSIPLGSDISQDDQKSTSDSTTVCINAQLTPGKLKVGKTSQTGGSLNMQKTPTQKKSRRRKETLEDGGSSGEDKTPKKRAKKDGGRRHKMFTPTMKKPTLRDSDNVGVCADTARTTVEQGTPKQAGSGSGQKSGNESGSGQVQNSNQKLAASTSSQSSSQDEKYGNTASGSSIMGGGGNSGGGGNNGAGKRKEPISGKISDLKPCKVLMHKYVIRPAPIPPAPKYVKTESGENHILDQDGWMAVFARLSSHDLVQCLKVCKTWYRWALKASLWKKIDLSNTRIMQAHLIGIVKRQPQMLNLSYTNINYQQMSWLIARLPHLKSLDMTGNSWAAVSALCTSSCPLLLSLNLSWVSHLQTLCIKDLLSPPLDHRPGVDDSTSRFRNCTELILTGSDITDAAMATIHLNLPKIEKLSLSCCTLLTDTAMETVSNMATLKELDISKCSGMTSVAFEHLKKLDGKLRKVNIKGCAERKCTWKKYGDQV